MVFIRDFDLVESEFHFSSENCIRQFETFIQLEK